MAVLRENSLLEEIEKYYQEKRMPISNKKSSSKQLDQIKEMKSENGKNDNKDEETFKKLFQSRKKLIQQYKLAHMVVKREELKLRLVDEND